MSDYPDVSVVLCTWNGERHLAEQLASIAGQSVLPRELIVADDASEDNTVAVVESFAARAPFEVRIIARSARLGVARNFGSVLDEVAGELVALSDQDDRWHPTKLERLSRCFDDPAVWAAASDARLVDEEGCDLGRRQWQASRFSRRERRWWASGREFDVLLRHNPIAGTTLLVRGSLLAQALPIPGGAIHDYWLLCHAAIAGRIALVDEPLTDYRQHANNAIGANSRGALASVRQRQMRRGLWSPEELFRSLAEVRAIPLPRRTSARSKADFERWRNELAGRGIRRVPSVLRSAGAGEYRRFASDWRSMAADLLIPRRREGS